MVCAFLNRMRAALVYIPSQGVSGFRPITNGRRLSRIPYLEFRVRGSVPCHFFLRQTCVCISCSAQGLICFELALSAKSVRAINALKCIVCSERCFKIIDADFSHLLMPFDVSVGKILKVHSLKIKTADL
jgi:hypothetical protein